MSRAELERFQEDLRQAPVLLQELRDLVHDPAAAMRWASEKGYDLSRDDVEDLHDSDQALTDDELDHAAGGDWGTGTGTGTGTGGTGGGGGG